jgi:hypothetical protein
MPHPEEYDLVLFGMEINGHLFQKEIDYETNCLDIVGSCRHGASSIR